MPKYRVETDQGQFDVELDQAPTSDDQLHTLVQQHLAGGQAPLGDATAPPPGPPPPSPPRTLPGALVEGAKNLPGSALNLAKGVGQVALGGIEKGLTAVGVEPTTHEYEPQFEALVTAAGHPIDTAKALGKSLVERYGSWDKIKDTIATDPAGFALDLSTVLGLGGGALRAAGAGKLAKVAEAGSRATDLLAAPGLAYRGAKKVLAGAKRPERIYQSALKPSKTLTETERAQRIATGLTEAIPVSPTGFEKLAGLRTDIEAQVDAFIDKAHLPPGPRRPVVEGPMKAVSIESALAPLESLKENLALTLNPKPLLAQVDKIKRDFIDAHGQGYLSPQAAQTLKKNTYRMLDRAYEQFKRTGSGWDEITDAAGKRIGFGIKTELERLYPELATLNPRDGSLIALQESLSNALGSHGNTNLVGVGTSHRAGMGQLAAGKVGSVVGALSTVINIPAVSSRLAIALAKARKAPLTTKPGMVRRGAQVGAQVGRVPSLLDYTERRNDSQTP